MYETADLSFNATSEALFDWKPDAERLSREVRDAELKGIRDELTLAEIECSLDLIDAELSSLRRKRAADLASPQIRDLEQTRGHLMALASRLARLPC
jgi:hypothetical protein